MKFLLSLLDSPVIHLAGNCLPIQPTGFMNSRVADFPRYSRFHFVRFTMQMTRLFGGNIHFETLERISQGSLAFPYNGFLKPALCRPRSTLYAIVIVIDRPPTRSNEAASFGRGSNANNELRLSNLVLIWHHEVSLSPHFYHYLVL